MWIYLEFPLRPPPRPPLVHRINQRGELHPYATGLTPPSPSLLMCDLSPFMEPFEERINLPSPLPFAVDPTLLSPSCKSILDQIKISPTEMDSPLQQTNRCSTLLITPHPFYKSNPPSMRKWYKLVYKDL